MSELAEQFVKDLQAAASEANRQSYQRFFKEPILIFGCKSAQLKAVFKKHLAKVNKLKHEQALAVARELFSSPYYEPYMVGMLILEKRMEPGQVTLADFENLLYKRVSNWAECDVLCGNVLYKVVRTDEQSFNTLRVWAGGGLTKSKKSEEIFSGLMADAQLATTDEQTGSFRWIKRASVVCLIKLLNIEVYRKLLFELAEKLISDHDDLVAKGLGWSLKEAASVDQAAVTGFLEKYYQNMSRTAIRYAIEKYPEAERKRILTLK